MKGANMFIVIVRENALIETVMVFQDLAKAEDWCRLWADDEDIDPGPELGGDTDEAYRREPWLCDWISIATGIDFFIDIHEVELSDPDPVVNYRCREDGQDWSSDGEARCPACGNSADFSDVVGQDDP